MSDLIAGIGYTIGDFRVILNEETKELKVIVVTNGENIPIQPKSDNCVILRACTSNSYFKKL